MHLCADEPLSQAGVLTWVLTIILGLLRLMSTARRELSSHWRGSHRAPAVVGLMAVWDSNLQGVYSLSCLLSSHPYISPGTTSLHNELEECVASFVGKPAAVVFGMGYATNSSVLPVLIGKVAN